MCHVQMKTKQNLNPPISNVYTLRQDDGSILYRPLAAHKPVGEQVPDREWGPLKRGGFQQKNFRYKTRTLW